MSMIEYSEDLKGKRIVAIDYGQRRLGLAVCDELHISVTPKAVLDPQSDKFWDNLKRFLIEERAGAIVAGVPYRHDGSTTELIEEIAKFIEILKEQTGLTVIPYDESYSSRRASATMIQIGKKKRKRSQKGSADMVAAAIILRDFLNELDNNNV